MYIIGYVLLGVFALLSIQEIVLYARARRNPEDFPYPRRRLSRRLAIAILFCTVILLVMFWPRTPSLPLQFLLLALLGVGLLVGLVLLWRDLHETSRSVVKEAARFNERNARAMMEMIEKDQAEQRGKGREARGKEDDDEGKNKQK